jgi:hypothetical protein
MLPFQNLSWIAVSASISRSLRSAAQPGRSWKWGSSWIVFQLPPHSNPSSLPRTPTALYFGDSSTYLPASNTPMSKAMPKLWFEKPPRGKKGSELSIEIPWRRDHPPWLSTLFASWMPLSWNRPQILARQRLFQIRQGVCGDGDDRCVFRQLLRHDLVQGVGGCVVIVKVGAVVLDRAEPRNA